MKTKLMLLLFIFFATTPFLKGQNDLLNGLVAHYSLDGNVDDSGGNLFHGTGYNITYETGPVNQSAVFNGNNSRIYIPEFNTLAPDSICGLSTGTISVWFKFQNQGADILPVFYFGEKDTGTPHNSLIIEVGHAQDSLNRKLYFTIVNQSFCFDSNMNLSENTWYHFAAVVSNTGNTGYLNGVEMTDRHYNLGSDSNYTDFFADVPVAEILTLGFGRFGQQDPFFHFKGSIDDVRIYNRALSSSEISDLYNLQFTGVENSDLFNSVSVFPNPTTGIINIDRDYLNIQILNVDGTVIISQNQNIPLHIGNLSNGIYIAKITLANRIEYQKIILHK